MSANNYIRIKKKGKVFTVDECDADTQQPYFHVGEVETLEKAVGLANKYEKLQKQEGYDIEYGLNIQV